MKKIAEINKEVVKPIYVWFIGIAITLLTGILLNFIYPFSLDYIQPSRIKEILLIIPTVFLVFLSHECIHILFFILFGQGKAKIEIKKERKMGAIIMHQVNEDVFYSKIQMVIILLAPFVFLTALLIGLMFWIKLPYLFYVNILLNTIGSSIDFYLTIKLLTYPFHIWINFDADKLNMNIYEK